MPFLATSQKSQQVTEREPPISSTMSSSNKLKEFETVFPRLVKDLEENAKQYKIPEEALKWYSDVCSWLLPFKSISKSFSPSNWPRSWPGHPSSHSTTTPWAGNATAASPSQTPPPSSSLGPSKKKNTSSPRPSAGSPSSSKHSS